MKLTQINETLGIKPFYKGMTIPDFNKFKTHKIPGFMSDLELAIIYADPNIMPNPELGRVIITANINTKEIKIDPRIKDMCGSWQDDPTSPLYHELRNKIWTGDSGGHGKRGIYVGKPTNYTTILHVQNTKEWNQEMEHGKFSKIYQKITSKYPPPTHDPQDCPYTWKDYL